MGLNSFHVPIYNKKKSNLYGITPKRVTAAEPIFATLRLDNTAPKKHRNGGEAFATLCPILPAAKSYPCPPLRRAMSLITAPTMSKCALWL